MAKIRVTQVKSTNGTNPTQKGTLRSLKLGRIGKSAEHTDDPTVLGAIHRVRHLVKVEEA
jgi:large subunit ribosomal protein L30